MCLLPAEHTLVLQEFLVSGQIFIVLDADPSSGNRGAAAAGNAQSVDETLPLLQNAAARK